MTGAPAAARNAATFSSRCSHAPFSGRTAAVDAATLATTGDGRRCTITLAPLASTTGSELATPRPAATLTAARTAASVTESGMVKYGGSKGTQRGGEGLSRVPGGSAGG